MDASLGGKACREAAGKFLSTERESGRLVGVGVVMRQAGSIVGKLLLDELRKDADSDHIGWWCSGGGGRRLGVGGARAGGALED
jgi:hypothetical protein